MVVCENLIQQAKHAYLIGIGGAGMSSLARVLKCRGLQVSGSDLKANRVTEQLLEEGIKVFIGQKDSRLSEADLVVYSSAIGKDHLELLEAKAKGLRIYHRAEILSSILNNAKTSVAVTGTHGKTTTSSMIAHVLSELGQNPTCLIGADLLNIGSNTILGNPDLCVAEVDESDRSHEMYAPNYVVLTNLEEDHLDQYADIGEIESSFMRFLGNVRNPGVVIYSADDESLDRIMGKSAVPRISFGLSHDADFSVEGITLRPFGSEFDLMEVGFYAAAVKLQVPGIHNVMNALAAITLLIHMGLDLDAILKPLATFKGARRRLEVKWQSAQTVVIDDYAHHPTEVRACIDSLRRMGKKVTAIFQPHRYSRTEYFHKEFARALFEADEVILTRVYPAGELPAGRAGTQKIYDEIIQQGHPNAVLLERDKILDYLEAKGPTTEITAFVGAGDIGELANEFALRLQCQNKTKC